MTKIVPYASFPYADHALRQVGVENPNMNAEATDAHIDLLIAAANCLRTMVRDMENLEDIRGFITYSTEEVRESPAQMIKTGDDEENKAADELEKLQQETE